MNRHCLVLLVLLAIMSSGSDAASSRNNDAAFAAAAAAGGESGNDSGELPQLGAADPERTDMRSMKLGETMSFAEMGPIIINMDGTTRRIDNWNEMTEKEQEVSWRRISKRNEERRKKLLEKMEQDSGDGKVEDT
jgi:hypothetical protein